MTNVHPLYLKHLELKNNEQANAAEKGKTFLTILKDITDDFFELQAFEYVSVFNYSYEEAAETFHSTADEVSRFVQNSIKKIAAWGYEQGDIYGKEKMRENYPYRIRIDEKAFGIQNLVFSSNQKQLTLSLLDEELFNQLTNEDFYTHSFCFTLEEDRWVLMENTEKETSPWEERITYLEKILSTMDVFNHPVVQAYIKKTSL